MRLNTGTDVDRHTSEGEMTDMGVRFSRAVSTLEYALILAGVAVVVISAALLYGLSTRGAFERVAVGLGMEGESTATQTITATLTITTTTATATMVVPTATDARPLQGTATPATGGGTSGASTPLPRQSADFSDDFGDDDADDWYVTQGGIWTVENGQYCNDVTNRGERRSFVGDPSWTDYTVSVRSNLVEGNGWGLYFRATDLNSLDAYVLQYDPGYGSGEFLFRQVVDSRETSPFGRADPPPGFEWYNTWHTVSVQAKGSTFTAYVDGNQVLEASQPDYAEGQVGLRMWDSSVGCFDDIVVTQLDP